MKIFGVICPAAESHVYAMLTLAIELKRRGHRVIFYQFLDNKELIESAGFEFRPVGAAQFPRGRMKQLLSEIGEGGGMRSVKKTVALFCQWIETNLSDVLPHAKKDQLDFLIIDQTSIEGSTIAEVLRIPFVSVANALLTNRESQIPPFFYTWSYSPSVFARIRNAIAYLAAAKTVSPVYDGLNAFRASKGLPKITDASQTYSKLVQLVQLPMELDFPRKKLPRAVTYIGPLHDTRARPRVAFPYDQLDPSLPLIYASLGTILGRKKNLFRQIAEACADLKAEGLPNQLVIGLGGAGQPEDLPDLPGNPIIVRYAPQLELLDRAALCITHAGMNSVLEALARAVPLVAIPITNDQPGVAARVRYAGAGELVSHRRVNRVKLKRALKKVLTEAKYKEGASKLSLAIKKSGGRRLAADLIDQFAGIVPGPPV